MTAAGRVRLRVVHVAPVVALVVIAAIVLVATRGRTRRDRGEAPLGAASPAVAPETSRDASPTGGTRDATAYFPMADAVGLRAVRVEIPSGDGVAEHARALLRALVAGSSEKGLLPPLPASTEVRAVFVDPKGTAYVDLSGHAVRDAPGGSAWERLAVASVANSLTKSFPEIRRVQILVDGQEVDTLTGHLDLSRPVAFDASLVVAP